VAEAGNVTVKKLPLLKSKLAVLDATVTAITLFVVDPFMFIEPVTSALEAVKLFDTLMLPFTVKDPVMIPEYNFIYYLFLSK